MTARTGAPDDSRTIPILVAGARIRALLVGGGAVAARKLASLLEAGASHVRVVATELSPAIRRTADAIPDRRVELIERAYETGDVGDANLVIAATNVREVNARVARDADRAGRLVSVADAPGEGAWTSMATHRAGPLVIAVAAGGVPTAAARVRDAIATRFDRRYAHAVSRLASLRGAMIARGDASTWREAAAELIGDDFCESVEHGTLTARLDRREKEGAWA